MIVYANAQLVVLRIHGVVKVGCLLIHTNLLLLKNFTESRAMNILEIYKQI